MTSVKWAACWHSKPHGKDDNYKSVPSPSPLCFLLPNAVPGPYPGQSSHPLWIRLEQEDLQALGSTSPFSPLSCSLHRLSPLLHLHVYLCHIINLLAFFNSTSGAEMYRLHRVHISLYTHQVNAWGCTHPLPRVRPHTQLFLSFYFRLVKLYTYKYLVDIHASEWIVCAVILECFKPLWGNLEFFSIISE